MGSKTTQTTRIMRCCTTISYFISIYLTSVTALKSSLVPINSSLSPKQTCLSTWNLTTSACDYESLLSELKDILPDTCSHGALEELRLALNIKSEEKIKVKISTI